MPYNILPDAVHGNDKPVNFFNTRLISENINICGTKTD